MTYAVLKDCDWKSFNGRTGQTLDAAQLKTADGERLPPEVVAHFVSAGALAEVKDAPAPE